MRYLTNSLILVSSFILIYIEEQFLSDYRAQIIGLLIIGYFAVAFLRNKYQHDLQTFNHASDIFIVNSVVLLLIIATGSLYSPIFFLLYFLCFGITFIFEPISVFIFAIGAVLIFLPQALTNYALESFIKIGSLFIIAPLAFFFGKEYKDRERLDKKLESTKKSAQKISQDITDVIKEEPSLSPEDFRKLNEVLRESEKVKK